MDFKFRTLHTLLNEIGVHKRSKIDFLKIDIEGLDLIALKSFVENRLKYLHSCMIQVPSTFENSLYQGKKLDLGTALNRLNNLGFLVYAIRPNDGTFKEFNIFFKQRNFKYSNMEINIGLPRNSIYRTDLGINNLVQSFGSCLSWIVTKLLRNIKRNYLKCVKFST